MELSVRDWMILIGVLLIVAVLLDGYRRMRDPNRIRVSLSPVPEGDGDDDIAVNRELPHGGARVKSRGETDWAEPVPEAPVARDDPAGFGMPDGGLESTGRAEQVQEHAAPAATFDEPAAGDFTTDPTETPPQPGERLEPIAATPDVSPGGEPPLLTEPATTRSRFGRTEQSGLEADPGLDHPPASGPDLEPLQEPVQEPEAEPVGEPLREPVREPVREPDPLLDEVDEPAPRRSARDLFGWARSTGIGRDRNAEPAAGGPAAGDPAPDASAPDATAPDASAPGENLDLLEGISAVEPDFEPQFPTDEPEAAPPEEVLMLHVVARDDAGFQGEDILHVLLAYDLRFGEMNFFHHHETSTGRGAVQFSVANMLKPGVFDIDAMSDFSTTGLIFFLTLPGPGDMMAAFETMVETVQGVARDLGGDVLDETRSATTQQTLEHMRQRIRELERKLLAQGRR